jgi:hypothetical protein
MTDCGTLMTPEEVYAELNLDETKQKMSETNKRPILFQACSAKNGDGIWEGIGSLQEAMNSMDQAEGA